MAKFIVKERQYAGTYRNPYLRGGRGMKWGPWKTRSSHDTLREALAAAVVTVGLAKRAVFYKGSQVSDNGKLTHPFGKAAIPFGGDAVAAEEARLIEEGAKT